jgi:hypothetical protein
VVHRGIIEMVFEKSSHMIRRLGSWLKKHHQSNLPTWMRSDLQKRIQLSPACLCFHADVIYHLMSSQPSSDSNASRHFHDRVEPQGGSAYAISGNYFYSKQTRKAFRERPLERDPEDDAQVNATCMR